MLKVYDGIDVKQDGRAVNVAANVPQEIVDKFLGTFIGQQSADLVIVLPAGIASPRFIEPPPSLT